MLILTRKIGETITIGDEIKVQVMAVKGRNVSLGIEAPGTTSVHRGEIFERIQEANRQAAVLAPDDLSSITAVWAARSAR